MQIRTSVKDGVCRVEVVDPSDGAVTYTDEVTEGNQCVVSVPGATSPADLEYGGVEAIPEAPASEGEGTGTEPPAPGEEAPADGGATPEPTTSAASEKPLYLVEGEAGAPEGFEPSGLETPDGKTLYHFASDTAGQSATGNTDGVSIYADADDNEQPVVAVPADAAQGQTGEAAGAEAPANGEQSA